MRFPNGDNMFVNVRFGNFYYRATDLVIPSKGFNVEIRRYYNSDTAYDPGYDGWYFNFDERLVIDQYDFSVMVKFPDGLVLRFEYDAETDTYNPTTDDNYLQLERHLDANLYIHL